MYCLYGVLKIKRVRNGNIYYYSGTSKRINGKPRIVNLRYLGTAESIIRRLESKAVSEPVEGDDLSFGTISALWGQAKELDLISIIDEAIPLDKGIERYQLAHS